jgi:hypothetical protein
MNDRDLHFHDLRGTTVAKFYTANIPERVIAEIPGLKAEHLAHHLTLRRSLGRDKSPDPTESTKGERNAKNRKPSKFEMIHDF